MTSTAARVAVAAALVVGVLVGIVTPAGAQESGAWSGGGAGVTTVVRSNATSLTVTVNGTSGDGQTVYFVFANADATGPASEAVACAVQASGATIVNCPGTAGFYDPGSSPFGVICDLVGDSCTFSITSAEPVSIAHLGMGDFGLVTSVSSGGYSGYVGPPPPSIDASALISGSTDASAALLLVGAALALIAALALGIWFVLRFIRRIGGAA
jgi:hypothetical protein